MYPKLHINRQACMYISHGCMNHVPACVTVYKVDMACRQGQMWWPENSLGVTQESLTWSSSMRGEGLGLNRAAHNSSKAKGLSLICQENARRMLYAANASPAATHSHAIVHLHVGLINEVNTSAGAAMHGYVVLLRWTPLSDLTQTLRQKRPSAQALTCLPTTAAAILTPLQVINSDSQVEMCWHIYRSVNLAV